MYKILKIRDSIKVKPVHFGANIVEAIEKDLKEKYTGYIFNNGIILKVLKILNYSRGKLLPLDPNIHFIVEFEALAFVPEIGEVVVGKVIDITKIGAFVRIGPLDGFIHISQVMDDFITFDEKNKILVGKNTKRTLKIGDVVRAKIISISKEQGIKIGLTMRQPGLGSLVWIEKEKRQKKK
ncbi:MAG: DNA-directed RNA polymerase [Candidatus Aenigmatarchaeota archaeon]